MSDKCKFCGADMENARFDTNSYECGSTYNIELATWEQYWKCLSDQRDNLEAELKQLRDEDDTPPIDERLAAAGKIFRELVAEREELRREVERLKGEWPENWKAGIWEVKKHGDLGGRGATWLAESLEALTEAKQ